MFRRSKSEPTTDAGSEGGVSLDKDAGSGGATSGKGRPTPTRKEAEAAARARAKPPRTRKEIAKAQREVRSQSGDKMRAALKGQADQKYLPARDRGPVKAFVRDYVDSRFSLVNLLIPLMFIVLLLGWSGSPRLVQFGNTVLLTTLIVVAIEMVLLSRRLKKEIGRRFPEESTKGVTYYAVVRALQMRFMRLPKARVKIGDPLPETYR